MDSNIPRVARVHYDGNLRQWHLHATEQQVADDKWTPETLIGVFSTLTDLLNALLAFWLVLGPGPQSPFEQPDWLGDRGAFGAFVTNISFASPPPPGP